LHSTRAVAPSCSFLTIRGPRRAKPLYPSMLPPAEIDCLLNAVFEALDLAADDHAEEGYQVLVLGKQKALEGKVNVEPWAKELEDRWDHAIRRYVDRCGLARGPVA